MFLAERNSRSGEAGVGGDSMLSHPALSIEEDDTAEGEDERRDRPEGAKNGKSSRCSYMGGGVPKALPFCARNVQELYYLARCPPHAPSTPSSPRPSSSSSCLGIRPLKSGSFPCLEEKARSLAKMFSSTSGKKKY